LVNQTGGIKSVNQEIYKSKNQLFSLHGAGLSSDTAMQRMQQIPVSHNI
jgi:hypothetical protein